MQKLDNTYLINDTIFSKGPSSEGYSFIKYFLKKNKNIKSFLDIGCGSGILLKLMNKKVNYLGVDADAGIYKRKKHSKIKYFKNAQSTENYLIKSNKKYDVVALMDVLEHTDSFIKLFNIALKKSNKFVIVSLPNEDYWKSRLNFLIGKGVRTHGLEMIGKKPGHKHQWFVQFKKALPLLSKVGKQLNFKLYETMFFVTLPRIFFKRLIFKLIAYFIHKNIKMNNFCLIFYKN